LKFLVLSLVLEHSDRGLKIMVVTPEVLPKVAARGQEIAAVEAPVQGLPHRSAHLFRKRSILALE